MSLGDWEVYKTGSFGCIIDTVSPIVGSGSLKMTTASTQKCHLRLGASHSRGFLKGKVRTLMRRDTALASTTSGGLYCMGSQADLTAGGSAYWLRLTGTGPTKTVKVEKGDLYLSGTQIDTSTTLEVATGTVVALELEWAYDLAAWGGCKLLVRAGTQQDFSDLAQILDLLDESPLTTSVGEGVYGKSGTSGETVFFDETTIFELL